MSSTETTATSRVGEYRTFGFALGVILGLLAAVWVWRGHHRLAAAAGTLGGVAVVLAAVAPSALRGVHRLFLRVGHVLGWVNTHLILILIYYLLFTPVALVLRLLGKKPLALGYDPATKSYWVPRPPETRGTERYERMY
jgi:hypothetical protein